MVLIGEIDPFSRKSEYQPGGKINGKEEKSVGSEKNKCIVVAGHPTVRHAILPEMNGHARGEKGERNKTKHDISDEGHYESNAHLFSTLLTSISIAPPKPGRAKKRLSI